MSRRRNCGHGTLVNDTCVCDLLWTGESCQQRDCQAGQLRDGTCHCHLRHAGEFCEYQACYHKDVLYCWGLKDVQFLPCNSSSIGGHVDPETVKNAAWYCPCGQGRRTPPPYSHCVCDRGYGGEFCNNKLCDLGDDCSDSTPMGPGQTPFYSNNNGNSPGIVVPDSVKVALVCMSMVVLVALVIWLKRLCLRQRMQSENADSISEAGPNPREHYRHRDHPMTPAQLSATLLMIQARHNYAYGWEEPSVGRPNPARRGIVPNPSPRPSPLPSYDEANSAPPSYASILAHGKVSVVSYKSASQKASTLLEAEAGMAGIADAGNSSCPSNQQTPTLHDKASTISLQDSLEDEGPQGPNLGTAKNNWRRSL